MAAVTQARRLRGGGAADARGGIVATAALAPAEAAGRRPRLASHRRGDQGLGRGDRRGAPGRPACPTSARTTPRNCSAKAATATGDVRWHFLGPVQRNKVKRLAPLVADLAWPRPGGGRRRGGGGRSRASRLVQVNVTGTAGRPGCRPEEVADLVEHCRSRPLALSGLMAVGPAGDWPRARECFRWLASRARQLGLRELSMGMSDDFEVAVEEGATTLRLGRVLFGPRPSLQDGATIGFAV